MQDRPLAHEIATALEQRGMKVWTSDKLPPGGRIAEAIYNAVRDSDACLVIQADPDARTSARRPDDYMDLESDVILRVAAKDATRKVVPVIPQGRNISLFWRGWVPIKLGSQVEGDRLAHDVNVALASPTPEQDPFTEEELTRKRQRAREIMQAVEQIEAEP